MDEALLRLNIMISQCKRFRRDPPTTPDVFAGWLTESVENGTIFFTSNADIEIVSEQYDRGFYGSLTQTLSLDLRGLDWDDTKVGVFLDAMRAAASYQEKNGSSIKLMKLRLLKNKITDEGVKNLLSTLDQMPNLVELNLKDQKGHGLSSEMIALVRKT